MPIKKIVALLLAFIAIHASAKEIIIKGHIQGKLPSEIRYSANFNGLSYTVFYDSVIPDAKGNFTIVLNLETSKIIDIAYNYYNIGSVIAEPGSTYNLDVFKSDKESRFTFSGPNAAAQQYYNQLTSNISRRSYLQNTARTLLQSPTYKIVQEKIAIQENDELIALQKMLDDKVIKPEFFNLVRLDRKLFYITLQAWVCSFKLADKIYTDETIDMTGYTKMWSDVFKNHVVGTQEVVQSPWCYYYLESFLRFNVFVNKPFNKEQFKQLDQTAFLPQAYIGLIKNSIPRSQQEYFIATYLYLQTTQQQNTDKALLTIFEGFKKDYPDSIYLKYLTAVMQIQP